MAIDIVSFPSKNGDFPARHVSHYQMVYPLISIKHMFNHHKTPELCWLNPMKPPSSYGSHMVNPDQTPGGPQPTATAGGWRQSSWDRRCRPERSPSLVYASESRQSRQSPKWLGEPTNQPCEQWKQIWVEISFHEMSWFIEKEIPWNSSIGSWYPHFSSWVLWAVETRSPKMIIYPPLSQRGLRWEIH